MEKDVLAMQWKLTQAGFFTPAQESVVHSS